MSTASDLLAAIQLHPDEDTPRLIYADYLDENDQPERAEFIRIQVERTRLPYWELRARQFWHRERVLLAHHGQEWCRELGAIDGVEWGRFNRGFVSMVRVPSAKVLLETARAFRAVAPIEEIEITSAEFTVDGRKMSLEWVRGIILHSRGEFQIARFAAFLDSGIAGNLQRLDLSNLQIQNDGARILAQASQLTQLRELDFTECQVGNSGVMALAEAKHLASLEKIIFFSDSSAYVEDPFVTDQGIERLAAPDSNLKSLKDLDFTGTNVGNRGVQLLLTSPSFAHLESLTLDNCRYSPQIFVDASPGPTRLKCLCLSADLRGSAIQHLCALPQLSSLTTLDAGGCHLTPNDVRTIANAPFAPNLRALYLNGNGFGTDGMRELAEGNWRNLHTLHLSRNKLNSTSLDYFSTLGQFPVLTELALRNNAIEDRGARAIATAKWGQSLRQLNLTENKIGPTGAIAIAESPNLGALTGLILGQNPVGQEGVRAIAGAAWSDLTDLSLSKTKCGDEAARALILSPAMKNLLRLHLSDSDLTAVALEALVKADLRFLGELTLSENRQFGAEGINVFMTPGVLPALRFLSLAHCGLAVNLLEQFAGSELMTRIRRFYYHNNIVSQSLRQLFASKQFASLGADWVEEEFGGRKPRW